MPQEKPNEAQQAVQQAFLLEVQGLYATALSSLAGGSGIAEVIDRFTKGLTNARQLRDKLVVAAATPAKT